MPYIGKSPTAVPLSASDLNDDIISLAKLAGGTDGNIISYDTSGNPVAVATGTDGQVLTSSGADAVCAFEDAAGGNAPYFMATETTNQSLTDYTNTKANFTSEVLDSDNAFASSTFTVPVGSAGIYIIHAQCWFIGTGTNMKGAYIYIYKNGANFAESQMDNITQYYTFPASVSDMMDLAEGDTIDCYVKQDSTDSSAQNVDNAAHHTSIFYGYKIG